MLSIIAMQYRKSLNELFEQIEKCNDNNIVPASNMAPQPNMGPQPGMAPQPNMGPQPFNASQAAQSFRESNLSRQETLCEIGFWLSIVGAILPFFGIAYGLFIYIMNFYFAAQGMSTRKKPKAIITIIP